MMALWCVFLGGAGLGVVVGWFYGLWWVSLSCWTSWLGFLMVSRGSTWFMMVFVGSCGGLEI